MNFADCPWKGGLLPRAAKRRIFMETVRPFVILSILFIPTHNLLGDPASACFFPAAGTVANAPMALLDGADAAKSPDLRPVAANQPRNLDDATTADEVIIPVNEKPVDTQPILTLIETLPSPVEAPAPSKQPAPRNEVRLAQVVDEEDKPEPDEPGELTPKGGDAVIESVQVRDEKTERITVAKNSSAIINLKSKVDGVEIADPTIADVTLTSPTRVILTGRSYGTTQLILRVGEQQRIFTISVELDLKALASLAKSISPTSDIHFQSINGVIVLTGTVSDSETGERIVELASMAQGGEVKNQLTVSGLQQTMLRVVVAEVNKTALRQLGVNWAVGGSDWSRDFFFANNLSQLNPTVFSSSGLANIAAGNTQGGQMTYSVTGVGNTANTNVTFGFPRGEFQVFMNALRQNNLARVLAEPNIVAISGQTATFLAGGEVPIPVAQSGAVVGAITIEYKEFGVRLAFTPTILGGQVIRLHVMSEVSDAIPGQQVVGGLPIFSFTTRRVESTVECGNGKTFALAGLLREQVRALASKIPGLGDIPILGTLFSSTSYQRDDTELVVLVTPQLVEPLEPHQVRPPPGALMRHPNDYELFTLQQLEGTPQSEPETEGVPRDRAPVNTRPMASGELSVPQLALRGPWGLAEFEEEN